MVGSQGTQKGSAPDTSWERNPSGKRTDCIVIHGYQSYPCVIFVYTFGDFPADGRKRVAALTRRRAPNRGELAGGQGTSRRDGRGEVDCSRVVVAAGEKRL